jgi:hypothetical protein
VNVAERFWSKVDKSGSCWLWTRKKSKGGYGMFRPGGSREHCGAHRMSWILEHGPIPSGLCVLHRCDVRSCVRPDHLFLGTLQDNIADMVGKGRQRSLVGSAHPNSKLTEEQVVAIRRQKHNGATYDQLEKLFGVSRYCLHQVVNLRGWKHV